MLRKILRDNGEEPKYIETIHTSGYQFLAQVTMIEVPITQPAKQSPMVEAPLEPIAPDPPTELPPELPSQVADTHYRATRRKWGIAGGGYLLLLAIVLIWARCDRPRLIPLPRPLQEYEFEVVTLDAQGNEQERRKGKAKQFVEKLPDGTPLEMVTLPAGEFLMGTSEAEAPQVEKEYLRHLPPQKRAEIRQWVPHEMPQHRVTVRAIYLSKYEVTQEQWRAVAKLPKINRDLDPKPAKFIGDKLPVTHVSWVEVKEFCERLSLETGRSYRLPSESEWEYACRAGTTTAFHFGPTISPCYTNFNGKFPYGQAPPGEYRGRTTEVGSYKVANAFGLFDMHGNVWEMCQDGMFWTYAEASTDGSARKGDDLGMILHVTRGGAYGNDNDNPVGAWEQWRFYNFCAFDCRSARRNAVSRFNRYHDLGFRLALSAAR